MVKKRKHKSLEKLDIADHMLVPKHDKCSESEKKSLMQRYGVDLKDLPKISINDPALYELELKTGDIIRVTRTGNVAGKSVFYRVVIEL